jgi:hypothetical protein
MKCVKWTHNWKVCQSDRSLISETTDLDNWIYTKSLREMFISVRIGLISLYITDNSSRSFQLSRKMLIERQIGVWQKIQK